MTRTTENIILMLSQPNRLTQCLVHKKLHSKHAITALFTMELLNGVQDRIYSHTKSFTHLEYMHETELSKHLLDIKRPWLDDSLLLEILKIASRYQCVSKLCNLWLPEKVSIICVKQGTLINKKNCSNFQVFPQK